MDKLLTNLSLLVEPPKLLFLKNIIAENSQTQLYSIQKILIQLPGLLPNSMRTLKSEESYQKNIRSS
jgi:hypothetical protein